ncbi:MAG: DUF2079 domain-containing protein [Candidatus Odinarchaeota archaeon]
MADPIKIKNLKNIAIKFLDILIIFYFIFLVLLLLGGGFEFSPFGMQIKVHSLKNPIVTFIALLILRKLIRIKEPFKDFLFIKLLHRGGEHPFLLYIFASGYALIMSIRSILRHISYNTQAFDLGIFDQLLWNTVHGEGLYSSILGDLHFFGEHVSPILLLLAPLYWIYADPNLLLILQSCALASGAFPVYWLARKKLESNQLALLFSLLYLYYQPLKNVNLCDFHPVALATPLLLFAFFYLDQEKYLLFGFFLTLALLCKEEISLIVFIFGVYIAITRKKKTLGLVLSVVGLAIFALDIWVIIPFYGKNSFRFVTRYGYLGQSIPEMIQTLFLHPMYVMKHVFIPEKLEYFLETFGPVGFLSFLSPLHVLLGAPTFFQNILSDFPLQYSIHHQYSAPLTPFVFISAICGLQNVFHWHRCLKWKVTKDQIIQAVSVIFLLLCFVFYKALPSYKLTDRTRLADEFIGLIPPSASVSAQEFYVPHLAHRRNVYLFPEISDVEYIFLDLVSKFRGPITEMTYFKIVSDLLEEDYGVLAYEDNLVLLKKGFSRLENDKVPRMQGNGDDMFIIDGAILPSRTGKVDGNVRIAREGADRKGYVTYGPYFRLPKGKYAFAMAYTTKSIEPGEKIGEWDIGFTVKGKLEIVKKGPILGAEESEKSVVQEVIVSDIYSKSPVEFRTYYYGTGDLTIKNITIEKLE